MSFCFSLSQTAESKLRTIRPMPLCFAWIGRRHDELHCAVVFIKPGLFGHHKVVDDKRRGRPPRKIGRGLPKQHHIFCGISKRRIKSLPTRRKPCWRSGPGMSPSGNTSLRQVGPVMSSSGNTRPRNHNASPDPRFLASCPFRSSAKNRRKLL